MKDSAEAGGRSAVDHGAPDCFALFRLGGTGAGLMSARGRAAAAWLVITRGQAACWLAGWPERWMVSWLSVSE